MRNLALESTASVQIPCSSKGRISRLAHDLASGDRFIAVENVLGGEEVQVEVWKVGGKGQVDDVPCAILMAPAASNAATQVIALNVLAEQQILCMVLRGGTIATAPLEADFATLGVQFEVVGEVESGILSAAWSPEEDVLVLLTGASELLQMTPTFDVLSEASLNTTSYGEEQQVNVGWGSKSTQFHGSAGKQAAQAAPPEVVGLSPDDDALPKISWRGDAQFFSVSAVDEGRRVIRVYSRAGMLQNTSEPVPGLEHTLAWKPSGALIASTQRFGSSAPGLGAGKEGRHDVVFLERNGLRHGEFTLREEGRYRIKELDWSAGSEVLTVWIEREEGDVVQLWTINNYHWYLKHAVHPPVPGEHFTTVQWHPELSLRLIVTTLTHILDRSFAWITARSTESVPRDTGTVAIIDGSTLLMTPFRRMNVPPPMCGYRLPLGGNGEPPIDLAFDTDKDRLAVLRQNSVEVWELNIVVGNGKVADPVKVCDSTLEQAIDTRQVELSGNHVTVLGYDWEEERDVVLQLQSEDGSAWDKTVMASTGSGRLVSATDGHPLLFQGTSGEVVSIADNAVQLRLPVFCFQTAFIPSPTPAVIGMSSKGTLYAVSETTTLTLTTNCTSFMLSTDFLIYTTSAHQAHFVPIADDLTSLLMEPDTTLPEFEKRKVERGSRIVTVVPSNMALVLQMQRGNLETVNPRPLVLQTMRRDLDGSDYRSAFLACRKHRIDLNELAEHDPAMFMRDIPLFVEQVDDVDHINLFLTGIGQSSQSIERKNEICDAIRTQLEQRDLKRYVSSILTAHVVKSPSDVESGLKLLLRLRDENPEIVEEAIKYIIFLVDVDRLFNIALGMYDFSLVLMIAQHSQKDPREYLPFLRELAELEENYQRFRIDDHLGRHSTALEHLRLAGDTQWDRAKKYVDVHAHLWPHALRLWKEDKEKEAELQEMYGDYLMEKKDYSSAALAFLLSQKTEKALQAQEAALAWRDLFALATQAGASPDRLSAIGRRVADKLCSKRRYAESAQVLLDYVHDVDEAVNTLLLGSGYNEAVRVAYLHQCPELVEDRVRPSVLNSAENVLEDLEEMGEQLRKQVTRWEELQEKKRAYPGEFYHQGEEEEGEGLGVHDVDVMSATTAGTRFTRFTLAPTILTSGTGTTKSAKGRRKTERKRLSGKKGSVDEEEYLVSSVLKLCTRLEGVQREVGGLVRFLILWEEGRARELGRALEGFEREVKGVGTNDR
ncbi:IkappaB kinase complex IKAP component [Dacryopinax primogenitus]|uniref:Elongator complex protein 1 n=1 Tax=Dacryopinax primogenitus (strain DJM 731) TaxID=1858805 RepID=M5FRG9_DACPD|nr:IkappaB kinase complex IKAP component [Dacryopinax primogenitus]EJT98268.1 IkappaB kinase complex IKAP component [Dacryopinax primogenitus]